MYQLHSFGTLFKDRIDAGRQLALIVADLGLRNPIVLGLPRGGVIVAVEVAVLLHAPLDIVVSRKLGAPAQPELGIGAVASGGVTVIDKQLCEKLHISEEDLSRIRDRELTELQRREEQYRHALEPVQLGGREVVLVDDGLATGVTALAAIRSVRLQSPDLVVAAFPVCSPNGRELLKSEVDRVVTLAEPPSLRSVGQWYEDFSQTSDSEVVQALQRSSC